MRREYKKVRPMKDRTTHPYGENPSLCQPLMQPALLRFQKPVQELFQKLHRHPNCQTT
jgi:hypothetical protein